MTFSKISGKFGQWADKIAATVYGLGFTSEDDLKVFMEKFKEAASAVPKEGGARASSPSNAPPQPKPKPTIRRDSTGGSAGGGAAAGARGGSAAGAVASQGGGGRDSFGGDDGSGGDDGGKVSKQLKWENERLKIALSTSGANAKKWEHELSTLKDNNTRLKTALLESASNVEDWKKQLTLWKEDGVRLKARVRELEAQGTSAGASSAQLEQAQAKHSLEVKRLNAEVASLKAEKAAWEAERMGNQNTADQLARMKRQAGALTDDLGRKLEELDSLRGELEALC